MKSKKNCVFYFMLDKLEMCSADRYLIKSKFDLSKSPEQFKCHFIDSKPNTLINCNIAPKYKLNR